MIGITPAIKSLKIRNLGIIRKADFKFTKGINIIYGVSGSGKTTVVNAIGHLACGKNLIYTGTKGEKHAESMKLALEVAGGKICKAVSYGLGYKSVKIKTKSFGKVEYCYRPDSVFGHESAKELITTQMTLHEFLEKGSQGERTYLKLIKAIDESCKGQAVLLDDVFCMLDQEHKERALEILKKSKLQVIMTLSYHDEFVKGANVIKLKFVKRDGKPAVYS